MHLFPDAFVNPPGKPFVDAVPVPILGWKEPPLGAGAVDHRACPRLRPGDGFYETFAFLFLTDIQVPDRHTSRCGHAGTGESWSIYLERVQVLTYFYYNQMSTEPNNRDLW